MNKKLLPVILKAPLVLLVVFSFIASIYAAHNNIQGVTYWVSLIFFIVLLLYIIGIIIERKKDKYY